MLTDDQIKKISTVVNTLIDVPLVPESIEQSAFEKAVSLMDEELEKVLPPSMTNLLSELTGDNPGLDRSHSGKFVERLVTAMNKRVDIPFLGEEQEEKLIRIVIELVVKAMSSSKSLDNILDRVAI